MFRCQGLLWALGKSVMRFAAALLAAKASICKQDQYRLGIVDLRRWGLFGMLCRLFLPVCSFAGVNTTPIDA